jgi:hypothetical protein
MDFTSNVEALTAKAKITLKESGMDQPVEVKKPNITSTSQPAVIKSEPPTVLIAPPPAPVAVKEVPVVIKETPRPVNPPQQIQNFNSISEIQSIGSTSKQS